MVGVALRPRINHYVIPEPVTSQLYRLVRIWYWSIMNDKHAVDIFTKPLNQHQVLREG